MEKGKKRQLNLELLRILCMLMIVTMHTLNHGGVLWGVEQGSLNYYLSWLLFGVSFVSISCYILISGYFLYEKRFSFYRILKMEGQVLFYSIALFFVGAFVFRQEIEVSDVVFAFSPIFSCEYWFVTMYMGMLMLSPFLNRFLKGLSREQFRLLAVLLILLLSVWPTVFFFSAGLNFGGGSGVTWFVFLYILGAYVRRFHGADAPAARVSDSRRKPVGYGLPAFLALLSIPACRFVTEWLLATPLGNIGFLHDLMWGYSIYYQYHSIMVLTAAILLFLFFLHKKVEETGSTAWIGRISPLAFGVYLIHDNPYMRTWLWETLDLGSLCGEWYLIPAVLAVVLLIFAAGVLLDGIRKFVAGTFRPFTALASWLEEKCAKLDEKVFGKVGL